MADGDALLDGPAVSSLVVSDGVATITGWSAPSAYATASSTGRLFVYNTGTSTSAAVVPAITGPDFAIEEHHSTSRA